MKKITCAVIRFVILGIAVLSTLQCANNNKLNELLEIIEEKQESSIFNDLKEFVFIDSEAKLILNLKDEIDETQLALIKLVDSQSESDELSRTMNFTNYLVKLYASFSKFSSTSDSFQEVVIYLRDFLESDKENDSQYLGFKRIALNSDEQMLDKQKLVLEQLTVYQECQDVFHEVLEDVLRYVTSKDMKSAAELLNGEDVQNFYLESAKTLNVYYDFIVSRAESIVDSCIMYETMTQQ